MAARRIAAMVVMTIAVGCDRLPTDPGEEPQGPAVVANRLAVGVTHSCVLTREGVAYCWGANESGQLGDGTFVDRPSPVRVATEERFVAIDAAGSRTTSPRGQTCALTAGGEAYCWGSNEWLQLGISSQWPAPVPTRVSIVPELVQISTGYSDTCGVTAEGEIHCWGGGGIGGGERHRKVEAEVAFASVDVGGGHACALSRDGDAFCIGSNHVGQLGDGTRVDSYDEFVPVTANLKFREISAGAEPETCAIGTDDRVYCWGRLQFDYQPRGNPVPQPRPGIPAAKSLDTGYLHACVVTADATALCWGNNGWGQLGDGTWDGRLDPGAVEGTLAWDEVALGGYHACGLTSANAVYCWGTNDRGQLGRGDAPTRGPVSIDPSRQWASVSAGLSHQFGGRTATSCGITATSELYCWGYGGFGIMGVAGVRVALQPIRVGSFVEVDVGAGFVCALDEAGDPWCWGASSAVTYGATPARLTGGEALVSLTVGDAHACGTTAEGAVYCWGRGDSGQVGQTYDGCLTPHWVGCNHTAVRLETEVRFVGLTAGRQHTCGVDTQGRAYCWGTGRLLGRAGATVSFTPQEVSGELRFNTLSAGTEHTCGTTAAGELYCWGENRSGQLGTGNTEPRQEPVQIAVGTSFATVTAGHDHTCAATDAGEVLCWGANASRQLGPAAPSSSPTPISAGAPAGLIGLSAGIDYTCGWRAEGDAFCWGRLGFGRLGNGEWAGSTVPVRVTF